MLLMLLQLLPLTAATSDCAAEAHVYYGESISKWKVKHQSEEVEKIRDMVLRSIDERNQASIQKGGYMDFAAIFPYDSTRAKHEFGTPDMNINSTRELVRSVIQGGSIRYYSEEVYTVIRAMWQMFDAAEWTPRSVKHKVLILLSEGNVTCRQFCENYKKCPKKKAQAKYGEGVPNACAILLADQAKKNGIEVYTIAVGHDGKIEKKIASNPSYFHTVESFYDTAGFKKTIDKILDSICEKARIPPRIKVPCTADVQISYINSFTEPGILKGRELDDTLKILGKFLDLVDDQNRTSVGHGGRIDLAMQVRAQPLVDFDDQKYRVRHFGSAENFTQTWNRVRDGQTSRGSTSSMPDALRQAVNQFSNAAMASDQDVRHKAVVLVSHGNPCGYKDKDKCLEGCPRQEALTKYKEADVVSACFRHWADNFNQLGIDIYTIVVGYNGNNAREIATYPRYFYTVPSLSYPPGFEKAFSEILNRICKKTTTPTDPDRAYYVWVVVSVAVICFWNIAIGCAIMFVVRKVLNTQTPLVTEAPQVPYETLV